MLRARRLDAGEDPHAHRVPHTRHRLFLALVPLLLVGSQIAHAAVEWFAPASYEGRELGVPGTLVPVALVVLFGGVAVEAVRPGRRLPFWPVALLPLAVFAAQEHVEYALGHGHVDWALAARWPFLVGLALQLPFAAAAYLFARFLLRVVRRLLAGARVPVPAALSWVPRIVAFHRRVAGGAHSSRGPPLRSST